MNTNVGNLIAFALDFNLFWTLTVDDYGFQVRGWYSKKLENYVLSKGFEKYDLLYADNPTEHEYKKGTARILLTKSTKK